MLSQLTNLLIFLHLGKKASREEALEGLPPGRCRSIHSFAKMVTGRKAQRRAQFETLQKKYLETSKIEISHQKVIRPRQPIVYFVSRIHRPMFRVVAANRTVD